VLQRLQVFLYNIYCWSSKIDENVKLLFGSHLQQLYTRLKFYMFLVKSSTEVVYCCARGFIYYLRAGCYICCGVLFWWCINSSIKCGFFGDILHKISVMLCRPVSVLCASSWHTTQNQRSCEDYLKKIHILYWN